MNEHAINEFEVKETHGILWRSENQIHATSRGLGWTSLYASNQLEKPYEDTYSAVDDHLIIVHLDGPVSVTRLLGKSLTRRTIAPGGLFILPGGLDFGVRLENSLNSLHVYLRKQVVDDVAHELGFKQSRMGEIVPCLGDHDLLIERLAISIQDAMQDRDASSPVYADYLARAMAAHLLHRHSASANMRLALPQGSFSKLQLQRATDFMEAHLTKPLTLAELASVSGLSSSHFARRFKIATGMPPHQYLIRLRVERAKRLLCGREPIINVALACGFTHQEHMTRIFRRVVGVTPAMFRRLSL